MCLSIHQCLKNTNKKVIRQKKVFSQKKKKRQRSRMRVVMRDEGQAGCGTADERGSAADVLHLLQRYQDVFYRFHLASVNGN